MDLLNTLINGGLLATIGVIIGIFSNRYFDMKNRQDEIVKLKEDVSDLKAENCLLCHGIAACLDGLQQLGANHTVPIAKNELTKHLNKKAHDVEE